jgi:hypothetical protein
MVGGGCDPSILLLTDVEASVSAFREKGEAMIQSMADKADLVKNCLNTLSSYKIIEPNDQEDFILLDPIRVLLKMNNVSAMSLFQHLYKMDAVECVEVPTN